MFKLKKVNLLERLPISHRKSFTLVELLVVISIIGILAAVIVVGLTSSRANARDAKRVSDIEEINNAIQLYADSHNGKYPATSDWVLSNQNTWNTDSNILHKGLVPAYLSILPVDPRNGSVYHYVYLSWGTDYKLLESAMESTQGQSKAANDGGSRNTCPATSGTCAYEVFSSGGSGY